jgi:hypothetical protein
MNKKLLAILAGAIISMGFNVAISADNQLTNLGAKTFTIIKTPEPNKFRMENSQFGFGGIVHKFAIMDLAMPCQEIWSKQTQISTNFYEHKFQMN